MGFAKIISKNQNLKMNGLFFTFEGTECSGKTTQIKLVSDKLQKLGFPVIVVREPGGTSLGEQIRSVLKDIQYKDIMTPEAELFLLMASRAQLVREVIKPALSKGIIVLSDRFLDSTIVYQGYGRGLNIDFIRSVGRIATDNIEPDLTFVLQISIAESYRRRSIRNNNNSGVSDRIEESGNAFFLKVESGYRDLAIQEPDRVKIIDAERSPETVAGNIWKYIDELLSRKMEKS